LFLTGGVSVGGVVEFLVWPCRRLPQRQIRAFATESARRARWGVRGLSTGTAAGEPINPANLTGGDGLYVKQPGRAE